MKSEQKVLEIPLQGKKIRAIANSVRIGDLIFDEFNPRISMFKDSHYQNTSQNATQDEIAFWLKSQPSYNELKSSIRDSGGAVIPIMVVESVGGKYVIVDGNTRVLIHKELTKEEGQDYEKINCFILPKGLSEENKDYIRLVCHLRGHTDWDKYERAKYLYKLYQEQLFPLEKLGKITKLSRSEIAQDIDAYKLMEEQFKTRYGEQEVVHKFSYFKEFVKNKKLKSVMKANKLSDIDFCDWVGEKKLSRAQDVRKLGTILKEKATRSMFLKKDLDRALCVLDDLIPEKSDKIYRVMSELSILIDKMPFMESQEIKSAHNPKKRKVVENLNEKLEVLLGGAGRSIKRS